jgi:hypothetical protein
MFEQAEHARWLRVQAEQCRASAYATSELEQRYSYIQLAECYEARAREYTRSRDALSACGSDSKGHSVWGMSSR